MEKKKGFTLIELLAVIIILAIIALIATPIVMRVIENAKKGAAERSIELYGKAVEIEIMRYKLDNSAERIVGQYKSSDDGKKLLTLEGEEVIKVDYKGNEVKCDSIRVYSDSTISMKQCSVQGIEYTYKYGAKRACTEGTNEEGDKIVTCGDEKFYVMNDYLEDVPSGEIIMLAQKNLTTSTNGDKKQVDGAATLMFSASNYFTDRNCSYYSDVNNRWRCPYKAEYIAKNQFVYDDVTDDNGNYLNNLYSHVNAYEIYLKDVLKVHSASATVINKEQLVALGCSYGSKSCTNAPSWVYSQPYWSGHSCDSSGTVLYIANTGKLACAWPDQSWPGGARPVVTISFDDVD